MVIRSATRRRPRGDTGMVSFPSPRTESPVATPACRWGSRTRDCRGRRGRVVTGRDHWEGCGEDIHRASLPSHPESPVGASPGANPAGRLRAGRVCGLQGAASGYRAGRTEELEGCVQIRPHIPALSLCPPSPALNVAKGATPPPGRGQRASLRPAPHPRPCVFANHRSGGTSPLLAGPQ